MRVPVAFLIAQLAATWYLWHKIDQLSNDGSFAFILFWALTISTVLLHWMASNSDVLTLTIRSLVESDSPLLYRLLQTLPQR